MLSEPLKILHLEDSPNDAFLIEHLLHEEFQNLVVIQVENQADYLREMHDPGIRVILSDYSLPAYDGIAALSEVRHVRPELPFIFVSGAMGEDMAVECMKIGATDYVLKSNLKRLPSAIRRALSELDTRLTLTEATRVARVVPWYWNDLDDTWLFGYLVKDILGYPPSELKSSPGFLKSMVHMDDLPRFISSFSLAKERERMEFDCRIRHGNGTWLWTRWTLAWADGRCRGILQDITELHATQDALIQSQRLETLGMMVGGITHDFGNLVAAMSVAVELLDMSPLTESQQRHVAVLAKSCERAKEFKKDLLRLGRKEDAPVWLPSNLNEVAQEAVTLLGHALPKSLEIALEPHEGLPQVMAVPAQLLQVLMNLGINARDAMGIHGRITLRTGLDLLSEAEAMENNRPGGEYVFVEVEDTGPGIPPEILPHVFDPFFTTKEKGKGTGLGLAMARAIVQQHDGVLQLHSEPGKGARFRLLLPVLR
jgi:two-component system, cell cycle sensor histidine kinase and response regulator CckA